MATRAPSMEVPHTQLSTAQYPEAHYGIYSLGAGFGAFILSIILLVPSMITQVALTVFTSIAVILLGLGSFVFATCQLHKHNSKSARAGMAFGIAAGLVFAYAVLMMTLKAKGFIQV